MFYIIHHTSYKHTIISSYHRTIASSCYHMLSCHNVILFTSSHIISYHLKSTHIISYHVNYICYRLLSYVMTVMLFYHYRMSCYCIIYVSGIISVPQFPSCSPEVPTKCCNCGAPSAGSGECRPMCWCCSIPSSTRWGNHCTIVQSGAMDGHIR